MKVHHGKYELSLNQVRVEIYIKFQGKHRKSKKSKIPIKIHQTQNFKDILHDSVAPDHILTHKTRQIWDFLNNHLARTAISTKRNITR